MTVILTDIIARFGVRLAMGAGILVAFLAWDHSRVNTGRVQERAKIEKATTNAAQNGAAAARKSITVGVRGKRDPTTRDD